MWNIVILQLLLLCLLVKANVEKLVFLGPQRGFEVEEISSTGRLDRLSRLSPLHPSAKHQFLARFPSTPASWSVSETWILVEGLKAGQRYEVRVCWSATVCNAFKCLPPIHCLSISLPTSLPYTEAGSIEPG